MTLRKLGMRALAATLGIAFGILVAEVGLRVLTDFPTGGENNRIFHPQLAYVAPSRLSDIDAHGFRNAQGPTPEAAEVFVVGDSHVFGLGSRSEETAPKVLEKRLGVPVYNLGVGSYGAYQYSWLLPWAAAQNPRAILLAIYLGNDLWLHRRVLSTEYWQDRLKAEGLTNPLLAYPDQSPRPPVPASRIADRFAVASAIRELVVMPYRRAQALTGLRELGGRREFDLVRSRQESRVMDLDSPPVRTNLFNLKHLLEPELQGVQEAGITLGVVLLPTAGRVQVHRALRAGEVVPEEYQAPLLHEARLARDLAAWCLEGGWTCIDGLDFLVEEYAEARARGEDFYILGDGHPRPAGYQAYASLFEQALIAASGETQWH